jgi:hypothetical protein
MEHWRRPFFIGYAIGALVARLLGRTARWALRGPVAQTLPLLLTRTYSSTAALEHDAAQLVIQGYRLVSITGLPGHVDVARAALDGRLSDVFLASLGIRSPDRIVAVFRRDRMTWHR